MQRLCGPLIGSVDGFLKAFSRRIGIFFYAAERRLFDFAGSVSAYVGKCEFHLGDFTPIDKNASGMENRSVVNAVSLHSRMR